VKHPLFGIETEYAFTPLREDGTLLNRDRFLQELMEIGFQKLPHLPDRSGAGMFLQNGARFYADCGEHPEYSTPECIHPWDLVRHVRAGDRILEQLAAVLRRDERVDDVVVLRSNVDHGGTGATWGSHESYLHEQDPRIFVDDMIPHLVSRIVYTGAGGFNSMRPHGLEFTLSPRVWHLEQTVSGESTHTRGIYHTKTEALSNRTHRLHLLCGESLCSDLATWLKVATTALVVALIDGGIHPGQGLRLRDPLEAMRRYASDPTCRVVARLGDGSDVTAVELQRRYLAVAEAHIDARFMPPFTAAVCTEWRAILDAIEQGPAAVSGKLDWAIKLAMYVAYAARNGYEWESLLAAMAAQERGEQSGDAGTLTRLRFEFLDIDTRFGQLGERGIFSSLDRAGALQHQVPGVDNIQDAVEYPPRSGRARVRGDRIRQLAGERGAYVAGWTGIWDYEGHKFLDLNDPFTAEVQWADWATDDDHMMSMLSRLRRRGRRRHAESD
jgi:proteasome accessory factor A